MLRIVGFTEEELAKIDLAGKTDEEIIQLAENKRSASDVGPIRPGQRAVAVREVGNLLAAGWEYVAPLGVDQAILRAPVGPP
jgi:hypothetical protein